MSATLYTTMIQQTEKGPGKQSHEMQEECSLIKGKLVDNESRCVHWHSTLDVIALRFKCCDQFYACYSCHDECETHEVEKYSVCTDSNASVPLIICGVCKLQMTFPQYQALQCPRCSAHFNPGCKLHYHLYFDS